MTPEELEKEFYNKFVMKGEPQMILLRDEVEELFQWIETQITKAKIEGKCTDCISFGHCKIADLFFSQHSAFTYCSMFRSNHLERELK